MKDLTLINSLDLCTGRRFAPSPGSAAFRGLPRPQWVKAAPSTRTYAAARNSRLTDGFGSIQTSGDTEIASSIRTLRARARELVRDAAFAKRAKVIVVNNIIGSGIGMQAQVKTTRDDLHQRVNEDIESAWKEWCKPKNCHTGGKLHFSDLERFAMGQVFEAGEVFIRKHYRPFGDSKVPYALEVIEPERVLDEYQPSIIDPMARVRMGVEMDYFYRPVAYWIRTIHPGDTRHDVWETDRIERVPTDQIIHLHIVDRWPQTRGVSWMHAAIRKLNDTDGYSEAEIIRARGQAMYMASLKTSREYGDAVKDASNRTIEREIPLSPGTTEVLYDGEELTFHATNSPNPTADPFLRYMLREVAAAIGVSYESLSRDYSQSNYSSSRLALLDDRDLWKVFQLWFIRSLREEIHADFMQAAVLSRTIASIPIESFALDPAWYLKTRYKPRGWSWIDPSKEENAFRDGVRDGFTTLTDVIAKTADGRDIEDVLEERAQELVLKTQIEGKYKVKLDFDTDPGAEKKQQQQQASAPSAMEDMEDGENNNNGSQGAAKQKQNNLRPVAGGGRK